MIWRSACSKKSSVRAPYSEQFTTSRSPKRSGIVKISHATGELSLTPDHVLLVDGEWAAARTVQVGSSLSGSTVTAVLQGFAGVVNPLTEGGTLLASDLAGGGPVLAGGERRRPLRPRRLERRVDRRLRGQVPLHEEDGGGNPMDQRTKQFRKPREPTPSHPGGVNDEKRAQIKERVRDRLKGDGQTFTTRGDGERSAATAAPATGASRGTASPPSTPPRR